MDLREQQVAPGARHPWEVVRLEFFTRLLTSPATGASLDSLLDVGAGDGWLSQSLLRGLPSSSRVTCWDIHYQPEHRSRLPDDPRMVYTTARPTGRSSTVLLLDVLEHVDDDRQLLRTVVDENLAADGRCLLSVPAWPRLYGPHDLRLGHRRRYSPPEARRLVHDSGLDVIRCGGLFYSLLPLRAAELVAHRVSGASDRASAGIATWHHGALVTAAVSSGLRADAALSWLLSRLPLAAAGLSWWAVCKRR